MSSNLQEGSERSSRSLSICIPAYNEGRSLRRMVENVMSSSLWGTYEGRREILICVNGSSDDTAAVAEHLASECFDVRWFGVEQKGKCIAWNQLVAEATQSSKYLFFLDADILVEERTLEILERELDSDSELLIVGPTNVPLPASETNYSWYQRLVVYYETQRIHLERGDHSKSILGRCYGIRRAALDGFFMPAEPADQWIGDDKVLNGDSRFVGKTRRVDKARVFFKPPSYRDKTRAAVRFRVRRIRISDPAHPFHYLAHPPGDMINRSRFSYFWKLPLLAKLVFLLNTSNFLLAFMRTRKVLREGLDPWEEISSSKL